jgi:hypothetical protein
VSTLITIADAVATEIRTAIAAARLADPTEIPATVTRDWDPILQTPEEVRELENRTVYVIPLGKEFSEPADRGHDRNVYRVGLLIVDKIPGELLAPTESDGRREWVDDAIEWVNDLVYEVVTDVEFEPMTRCYLQSGDLREVCSRGHVRTYGAFVSEIDLEFFIDESNT